MQANTHVIGDPKGGEQEKGEDRKNIWSNSSQKFSEIGETINPQVQEAQKTLSTNNMKKIVSRNIQPNYSKAGIKRKILKAACGETKN